jgi:YfiH family protein
MVIKTAKFVIFFGDRKSCPIDHRSGKFGPFCEALAKQHGLDKIIFSKQIHSNTGNYVDTKSSGLTGDFLFTDQKRIGVGVLTADCLPIIFYDSKNNVVAAVHAGWRSSVAEICASTVQIMFRKHKFLPEDLHVYFGPCAKACCYQVTSEFVDNLGKFKDQVIRQDQGKQYFDNVLFNKLLLLDLGLVSKNMNFQFNLCTICNPNFYSYRREGESSFRQISFIGLLF